MFKTQVEPRAAGEWFHCQVLPSSLNSAINCSEIAGICSWKFTSLAVTVGYRRFRCQTTKINIYIEEYSSFCLVVHSRLAHLDKN